MFPNSWYHITNLTHLSENGLTVMRTDISPSRIIIRTNDSIPLKEILKYKFTRQNSHDTTPPSPTATAHFSSSSLPSPPPSSSSSSLMIHSGIIIDPSTGVPVHETKSLPPQVSQLSQSEREQLYTDIGFNVYDSWESDVLRISGPVYYWEVQVLSTVNSDFDISSVALGLTPVTASFNNYRCSISDVQESISYHSSGTRFRSEMPPEHIPGSGFGTHDIVGCGWEIGGEGRVFFTCNGKIVGNCISGFGTQGQTYYPTLELYGIGTAARANFGGNTFQLLVSDRLRISNLEMVEYVPASLSSPQPPILTAQPAPGFSTAPVAVATPSRGTWTNRIKAISAASSPHIRGANTMEYPISTPSPRGLSGKNVNRRNSDGTGFSGVYGYPPVRQRTTSANNPAAVTLPRSEDGGIATRRVTNQRGVVGPPNSTEEELVALASALSLEDPNIDIDVNLPADSLSWTALDTQEVQGALALLQQFVLNSQAVTAAVEQKEDLDPTKYEVVSELSSNLRRMQKKLLRVIQKENENPEIYSALLELNHSVAFILDFAKDYMASSRAEKSTRQPPFENFASADTGRRRTESAVLPHELPSVVSIMYMLRRGSRAEVSSAVSQLLMMCDLGESTSDEGRKNDVADILNDIRSAGGLQTLVSALSRCNEWPDVELKISLAIAIMIANESDWHLLVKDVHSLLNTLQSLLNHDSELPDLLASADEKDYFPLQSLNARKLVATAISRLCLVLCAEWGKPSSGTFTDFGMFLISADVEQLPSSALQFHRKLSGNQERKHDRVLSTSDSEANLSKMLKTVMNIIKTLSPLPPGYGGKTSSPLSPRMPPTATRRRSSSQTAATTIPFDSSESLSLLNDSNRPSSNIIALHPLHRTQLLSSGSGTIHRCLSESSGINNQDKTVSRPVSLQLFPLTTENVFNQDPDASDTDTEPVIDDALVPCSVALSNLLQIEDCRATLVKDGTLSLLACWLDVAANVLQWHNSARFQASTPNTSDENNVGLNLTDFTSPSNHANLSPVHGYGQKKQLDIMRSSSVGSSEASGAGVGGILPPGHPVYELINNVSGSVMSLTTNSTLTQSENRRGRSPNSNYNAGRIDAMVMGEGLPSAICRFLYASTYDYTLPNLPSWKTLQSPILPRGGAIALSEAMCAMAKRSQNRESMLEAGAPQAIIRLFVDAILRRKKIDHGLDDDLPKCYPTEEYGPRKLERLHREHSAETHYLSTLAENCLQMLSHFVSDSIATIPTHKMNSTSTPLSTPHDWNNTTSASGSRSLPLIIQLLIHPRVVDAIKYITNQPRGTCRLAAVRVISMLVEWPEALDMLHSQRISDVLMVIVAESHDIFDFEVANKPQPPTRLERGTSRDSMKTESEADSVQTNSNQSLEVLMRACYTLAHICSCKLTYAFELFENGLMTIMLKSAKHDHIEVQRQAVRCISSMCPVLSSLIPGRHPAIVIEELQMNKNTGKVLRSRSDSINEIRARAAKAQVNLLAFVEALYSLAHALASQSTLVQREAVRGISFLAIDEHLRVGIVEGPLRVIIRILIDPSCEPELKFLAESVLVNIGFHNGQKDLEVVANDYELLSEWFYMRKSLRPQALGLDLLHHWVNTIFYGVNKAEKKTRQHFLLAELGREVSEKEFDENSMSLHLANGIDVDLRDTIDLLGLSLMKSMIERVIRHRSSERGVGGTVGGIGYSITPMNPNGGLHEALLQQFSHLFDAWKMLRNGIQIDLQDIDAAHSIVTPEFHIEHSAMPSMPPLSRSKTGGYLTDKFMSFLSFCSGRTQAQQILMEEEYEEYHLKQLAKDAGRPVSGMVMSREEVPSAAPAPRTSESNFSDKSTSPDDEDLAPDDLINHPPHRVQELLNLFFPSKLYQLYLTDMISLGQPLPTAVASSAEPTLITSVRQHSDACLGTPPRAVVYNDRNFSQRYKVPEPKSFRALLLPSRTYYTFRREGRIIQRIFDDLASNNPMPNTPDNSPSPSTLEDNLLSQMKQEAAYMGGYVDSANTLWTLCFRESTFQGEFMISLLSTLRRCPQIASLNFVSRRPEPDSELGYFAGSLPGNIRFISFEAALSSQALEVMCVMLKTQNPAFLLHPERDGFISDTDSMNGQDDNNSQGLLGLAIKSTPLSNLDIKSVCELLDPSENYVHLMMGRINEKDLKPSFTGAAPAPRKSDDPPSLIPPVPRTNGLRYLDLSENRLSDEQVSTIIYACIGGPLEGLELHGNCIYRGLYLSTPLQAYLASPSCQLTHLGLGANALINSTFRNILSFCQNSTTLTSLDFSTNSLTSSENTRIKVREYLKKNRHLRTLNLSNNQFRMEIVRDLHLGLMENESLILLNMESNISTNPREMQLVRQKLKLNRDRYVKGHPTGAGHLTPHAHAVSSFSTMAHHPPSGHPVDSPNAFFPSGSNEPLPKPALHNFVSDSNIVSSSREAIEVSVTIVPENVDRGADVTRKAHSEVKRKNERAKSSSVLRGVNSLESPGIRRQLTYDDGMSAVGPPPDDFEEDFSITLPDSEAPGDLALRITAPTLKRESSKKRDDREFDDYDLDDDDQVEEAVFGDHDEVFLSVLFSAPLAWQDTRNHLHPIQTLDYAGEREALVQVFHEAKRDVGLRFDFATTEALRTVVTLGCKALHFSGHGHPHCLNFEDGRSGLQFITIEQLSELCKAGDLKLEFVFVSACYSSKAAEAFVQAGVQHVVCVSVDAQLLDAAAMAFTRAFYLALLVGHTVRHSFDLGKQAVATSPYVPNGSAEGSKFLLLPETNSHDIPIFTAKTIRKWPPSHHGHRGITTDSIEHSYLPRPPEDFEGREIDMHHVIKILLNRRLVSVVGEPGVGKSAVAVGSCCYMWERKHFTDGIVYVRLQGVSTYSGLLNAISQAMISGSPRLAKRFNGLSKIFREKIRPAMKYPTAEYGQPQSHGSGGGSLEGDPIREHEDLLLHCLATLRVLLVLDHLNDILYSENDTVTDFKMFLSRLFERCRNIKVLTTCTDPIGLTHGFGMVENSVSIGPLSLRSSLRLFARLCPSLLTAKEKSDFVRSLLIKDQGEVTLESREVSAQTAQILYMLGGGHPGRIVKISCETKKQKLTELLHKGLAIIHGGRGRGHHSEIGPAATVAPAAGLTTGSTTIATPTTQHMGTPTLSSIGSSSSASGSMSASGTSVSQSMYLPDPRDPLDDDRIIILP